MDKIKSVMSSEGPVVKSVLLKADGTVEELVVDCTPKLKATHLAVRCNSNETIMLAGQWCDLPCLGNGDYSLVLIAKAEQFSSALPINTHKLQPPFHEAEIRGDVLLLLHDENVEPINFSREDYAKFCLEEIKEWAPEDARDEEEGDEEEDDDDDDDDNDDEDDDDEEGEEGPTEEEIAEIMKVVVAKYKKEHGHTPSPAVLKTLQQLVAAGDDDDDEDEDEDEDEA